MLVSVIFFVFGWVLGRISSHRGQSESKSVSKSGRVEGSDSCCDSLLDYIGGNGDATIC